MKKDLNVLIIDRNDYRTFGGLEKVLLVFLEFIKENYPNINVEMFSLVYSRFSINNIFNKFKISNNDSYFLRKLKENNINFHVVSRFYFKGLGFINLFFKSLFNLDLLRGYNDFYCFLKEKKFDVVLLLNPFYLTVVNLIIKRLGYSSKIIYWDHGILTNLLYLHNNINNNIFFKMNQKLVIKEIKKVIKSVDSYLCISSGIEKIIKELNPEAKTYLVYNPVEIPKGVRLIPRGENNILLYVGRIEDKQKNISFMLRGLTKLKEYKWELRVVGKGPDEEKLKKLASELGIGKRIKWEGFKKDPYEDLEEAKVLLLTSRWEGLPLVLLESNIRGIPFLSSNCLSGPEDIVIEGVNGYLYKEGDMEDFVNKLRKILINELRFSEPYEIHKTSYRFEKSKILNNITNIILGSL